MKKLKYVNCCNIHVIMCMSDLYKQLINVSFTHGWFAISRPPKRKIYDGMVEHVSSNPSSTILLLNSDGGVLSYQCNKNINGKLSQNQPVPIQLPSPALHVTYKSGIAIIVFENGYCKFDDTDLTFTIVPFQK